MSKPFNTKKIVSILLSRKVKPFVVAFDSMIITLAVMWLFNLEISLFNVIIGTAAVSVPYMIGLKKITKHYKIQN
tara:strand:- start:96450 stop:96674 length:225 start_codon:yes stop_codon:yes gene_type:complete